MQFYKAFKNNLVFFAILFLCASQPVSAGSVVYRGVVPEEDDSVSFYSLISTSLAFSLDISG
jgi:hypothetical protein